MHSKKEAVQSELFGPEIALTLCQKIVSSLLARSCAPIAPNDLQERAFHKERTGEAVMVRPRQIIDPQHCRVQEATCRKLTVDEQLTAERRQILLHMAQTWASLTKESAPQ